MSDPSHDDDWNDLARELGLEKSSAPPPPFDPIEGVDDPEVDPVGEERPAQGHGHEQPEVPYTGDEAGDEYEDAGEEAGPEGEGEGEAGGEEGPPGEGQPGTGRKRRRRRRRRKKGSGPDQPGGAAAEAPEGEPAEEAVIGYGRPTSADEEVLLEAEAATEDEAEEIGAEADTSPADEDTTSDVLRELIATWNVPSWDEIVGGLHRPGG